MNKPPVIIWFRRDLRTEDNPALEAAHKTGQPVIPLYILDEIQDHAPGGASLWWLHHSLTALQTKLEKIGAPLILRRGSSQDLLTQTIRKTGATAVFWNRRYYKPELELDKTIKSELEEDGISVYSFNGSLLREPWEVKTGSGGHYKVFSPYWRTVQKIGPARIKVASTPRKLEPASPLPDSDSLDDWKLLPTKPDWAQGFKPCWAPGENSAQALLSSFLKDPVFSYDEDRNRPDKIGTSRLSPHLAFGEISPLQIWLKTQDAMASGSIPEGQGMKFLSEVVWREFSYTLLYFYPDLPTEPLKEAFANYPWSPDTQHLTAWQKGQTGYPIVDAGMRELWQTGWMHNRVRMIVASFLIKHLLIPWQEGEKWFWDTLVDADIANNAASWQWVAGCGADAAPYFRIFNPFGQGEKFDPDGTYVKKFVPELAGLPKKYIHQPWTASDEILKKAGVILGENYPKPVVDHAFARKRALDGYAQVKGQ